MGEVANPQRTTEGMKKSVICVLGLVLALCMVMSCQKGKTTKSENAPKETTSKIMLSTEDSMLCMEVLGAYQDYKQSYADSAREKTEMINEDAGEAYLQNQKHVDSVLNECLILVRQRNYDRLLSKLETERVNFYSHPGNKTIKIRENKRSKKQWLSTPYKTAVFS